MNKNIHTLVNDIYDLFREETTEKDIDDKQIEALGKDIAETVKRRLTDVRERSVLRFSNMGRGDRQLYYDVHDESPEVLEPHTKIKFLYGDILEHLMIFLSKAAGHKVTDEQEEVQYAGVLGHIDCLIDDNVVDVKSASSQAFKKFSTASILQSGQDSFGYIAQLSGYAKAKGKDTAYFLVIDKTLGKLCLMELPQSDMVNTDARIDHMKAALDSDETPERCYDAVPDGKSGNMKLGTNCGYCKHKHTCWEDSNDGQGLRTFLYSNGPRYLTSVQRVPDVTEVTEDAN